MKLRRLIDEVPTKQDAVLRSQDLVEFYPEQEPEYEVAWGADPFDILAQLEDERGYPLRSH